MKRAWMRERYTREPPSLVLKDPRDRFPCFCVQRSLHKRWESPLIVLVSAQVKSALAFPVRLIVVR